MSIRFPPSRQPIAGGAAIDPNWERWFGDLARAVNDAGTTTEAPAVEYPPFVINGAGSVTASGAVEAGEFVVTLEGDKDTPPPNSFYGADTAGKKGFVPLYDGLEEGEGIALLDSGYVVIDTVASPDDLPLTGNAGEAVRVTDDEPGIYAWDGAAFTLDPAATGVVNVALAELADAGTGTSMKKIVRDAYGRVSATEDAYVDDLTDVDAASPSNGDSLVYNSGTSKWEAGPAAGIHTLIGSSTVLGSAATDITVSGLDLAAHGAYMVLVNLGNATGSTTTVSLFYNGDTTAANYYFQFWAANGSTTSASRTNVASIVSITGSSSANGVIEIMPDINNGYPRSTIRMNRFTPANMELLHSAHIRNNGANVTSLTLSSSVAGGFAVGSYVKVYRLG